MASYLFSVLAQKLADAAPDVPLDSYQHIQNLKVKLQELKEKFEEDDSAMEMKHKGLRNWVRDLMSIAQEAENAIDNYYRNIQLQKQGFKNWCGASHKIRRQLPRIKANMDMILAARLDDEEEQKMVLGFDEQINGLVKRLTSGGNDIRRDLCISGQPGAGKTTLLRKVYNHNDVKSCFELRVWVRHSTKDSLLGQIVRKVAAYPQEEVPDRGEQDMYSLISNSLKGKRYLAVLDINIHDLSTWDRIKEAFLDEMNGSKVLITSHDLVGHESNLEVEVHKMVSLSEDDRWNLFKNTFDCAIILTNLKQFVRERLCSPSEVVNMGALLSMVYERGGALSDVDDFLDEYDKGTLPGFISRIASQYNQLQGPEKLCFLYFGFFPQGFEIPTRRLVQLWLAEGWIKHDEELVANKCLIKMARKNMIQEFRRSTIDPSIDNQRAKTCGVDDILWQFCVMKAWQLNLYKIDYSSGNSSALAKNASRLSLHSYGIFDLLYSKASFPNLRSLLCFPQHMPLAGNLLFPSSGRFKLLKILDLEDMHFITQLPEDIGRELTELRYLGLRRTGLEKLPTSLGNFENLQTLDIKHTPVRVMPLSIRKLKYLQCLYMDMDGAGIDRISPDLSSLDHLRVCSMILAGEWMTVGLGKLTNLRKLGIYGDFDLCKDALCNGLPHMPILESLKLGFGAGHIDLESILTSLISNSVIQSLYLERPLLKLPDTDKYPKHLTFLSLKWSRLEQDPMATLGKLPYLKILKLLCGSFLGEKMVCLAKGFPLLSVLELSLLKDLEEWIVQKGAMPKLNRLVIYLCKQLKMLPEGLRDLQGLREFDVAGMPLQFSARLQQSFGDEWSKIQHVRSIIIEGIQMGSTSSSSAAATATALLPPSPLSSSPPSPPPQPTPPPLSSQMGATSHHT